MSIRSLRKRQHGGGMTETLVAAFVFAIGILGMGALQMTAKRTSYDALQRSQATALAHDIIERMRNNAGQLGSYVVDELGGGTIDTEPSPNCKTATCSAAQLAAHDIWEWEQALDGASEILSGTSVGGLVSPKACITNTAGAVVVAIAWKGYDDLGNPTGSTCGEGLNLYGTNEAQRQLLVIDTFIEAL